MSGFPFGTPQTAPATAGFTLGAPNTTIGAQQPQMQPQAQQPAPAFSFDNNKLTGLAPQVAAPASAPISNFGLGSTTTKYEKSKFNFFVDFFIVFFLLLLLIL